MLNEQEDLEYWRKCIQEYLYQEIDRLQLQNYINVLDIGIGESTNVVRSKIPHVKCADQKHMVQGGAYSCDICNEVLEQKFNVIFCVEVLEHTKQPWLAAENITQMLDVGGILIISVPTMLFWHPGEPAYGDYWRFMPSHERLLFPNLTLLHNHTYNINNKSIYPMGVCYTMKKES